MRAGAAHWVISILLALGGSARAETSLSLYLGAASTRNSDLAIRQPSSGSDAVFHDVSWDDKSFKSPQYYGVRLGHFFERAPRLGVALDFTHYKIYARTDRSVLVTGTWNGSPVNETAPLGNRVQSFDISHGVNLLALNLLYRWSLGVTETFPYGRWQPYIGGGPAYFILHPENTVNGVHNDEQYHESGFGYQLLAGVQYGLIRSLSVFAEAKYSSGSAKVDTANQGRAQTLLHTWHVTGGVRWQF